MSRTVPNTLLHDYYYDELRTFSTEKQTAECRRLIEDPSWLVERFLSSLAGFEQYRNPEDFGSKTRKVLDPGTAVGKLASAGTIRVTGGADAYAFRYMGREINPWRTTRAFFESGASAKNTGAGGVDYLGRVVGEDRPILGEIKVGSDQTPFYAFVQLLNYLSKFATANQVERCHRHEVFGGALSWPPRFDLHILLADFNDRGKKRDTIPLTRELASAFLDGLAAAGQRDLVGQVMCLRMEVATFDGAVSQVW